MNEMTSRRSDRVSTSWLILLAVFLVVEVIFVFGAYTSGIAGLEKIFSVFTGLILITFGVILYAGRLIFYD